MLAVHIPRILYGAIIEGRGESEHSSKACFYHCNLGGKIEVNVATLHYFSREIARNIKTRTFAVQLDLIPQA